MFLYDVTNSLTAHLILTISYMVVEVGILSVYEIMAKMCRKLIGLKIDFQIVNLVQHCDIPRNLRG
jgi:hypothetical protein